MEQIILVAQKLAKEGKTPTTALVKSRLPKNTPLAAIIQGLKLWKASPEQEVSAPIKQNEPSNEPATESSFDAMINALVESKITATTAPLLENINQLNAEIARLKLDVSQLQEKLNLRNDKA